MHERDLVLRLGTCVPTEGGGRGGGESRPPPGGGGLRPARPLPTRPLSQDLLVFP